MSAAPLTKASIKHRSFTGYSQVWLAQDHVLVLRSSRIKETYRRFLFSDIQAIVITEGPDSSLRRGFLGVGVLILLIWAWTATSIAGRVFLGSVSLIAIALMIREVTRGPRCRCVLQTAVTREHVDALSRTREARRFLEMVTPLIQGAQGHIVPPEARSTKALETLWGQDAAAQPPRIVRRPGFAVETFFGLLFFTALLVFAVSDSASNTVIGAMAMVYTSELVLGGLAVAQSRVRSSVVFAIVIVSIAMVAGDIAFLTGSRVWEGFMRVIALSGAVAKGGPQLLGQSLDLGGNILLFSVGWRIVTCAAGLFACRWERTQEPA